MSTTIHSHQSIISQIDVIKTKMEFLRKTIELTNSELNAAHATGTAVLNLATNGMAINVSAVIMSSWIISPLCEPDFWHSFFQCST